MIVAGLISLAVVDSINPSAIVITLYLLSRERAHAQVAVYIGAIFVTYLVLGVMMMAGLDLIVPALGAVLRSPPGLIAQALVGLAILAYSLTASVDRTSSEPVTAPSASTFVALVMLGVSVTAMELPTALPYFAAIAVLTSAELPVQEWAPLLCLYNAIFVLPPIVLLVVHLIVGEQLRERYSDLRQRLEGGARETLLWIAGFVGAGLFVTSVIELVARFV